MKYDYIEIGTSDFRTLIETKNGTGISVEPVKPYFDNLPDKKGWTKVNAYIGDDGKKTAYYVDPALITDEPKWVRGCNSIGKPHPTIMKMYPHLMRQSTVKGMSVGTFLSTYNVEAIGWLKIDAEGMDAGIVSDFLDTDIPIKRIIFEANGLGNPREVIDVIKRLSKNYTVKRIGFDIDARIR